MKYMENKYMTSFTGKLYFIDIDSPLKKGQKFLNSGEKSGKSLVKSSSE